MRANALIVKNEISICHEISKSQLTKNCTELHIPIFRFCMSILFEKIIHRSDNQKRNFNFSLNGSKRIKKYTELHIPKNFKTFWDFQNRKKHKRRKTSHERRWVTRQRAGHQRLLLLPQKVRILKKLIQIFKLQFELSKDPFPKGNWVLLSRKFLIQTDFSLLRK